jgi:hypothetical protein
MTRLLMIFGIKLLTTKSFKPILSSILTAIVLVNYPTTTLAEGSWLQSFFNYIGIRRDVRGKVGSRPKGGGGRGNCPNLAYQENGKDTQLMALIPEIEPYPISSNPKEQKATKIVWSYTIKEKPSFWFYVPYKYDEQTQVKFAKLAIVDEEKRLINRPPIIFTLPKEPGLVQVQIPNNVQMNLEINKPYKWFFSIVCDENKPSRNPSVSGWIQRILANKAGFVVEPSEDVLARISYRDMAKKGLWFDAFTRLAELYQSTNPQNYIQSSVKSEKFTKSLDNQIQEDWLAVFKVLELGDDKITSEIYKSPIFRLDCVSTTDGHKCD